MRDFAPDTFTENDVKLELERAGLKFYDKGRYLLAQCPTHDDAHPSVQIYKDDWFVNCHAGCGRFHITKAFPDLRAENNAGFAAQKSVAPTQTNANNSEERKMTERKYIEVDLTPLLEKLPQIPDDHNLHGVPAETLNDLGWRFDPDNNRYFIPYFSASRETIPFAQWRNLGDGPRFNFWKDAKPTMYGTWNLDNDKLFLVEGASDAAVLEYAAVPWIAAPSAASGELVKLLAGYCKENGIELVFAGDNDSAGLKLREAIDEIMPYRVKQVPTPYKDWGEFLEATDVETVQDYAFEELFGKKLVGTVVEKVWPDAREIKETDPFPSKEPLNEPAQKLF